MATRAPAPWEPVDHTGDLGVVVRGASLEELYERAAAAMFCQIAAPETVQAEDEERVSADAPDREALLVAWLSELLVRHAIDGKLYAWFSVESLSDTELRAVVRGEPVDPERHEIHTELKAVTYHGLEVARTEEGWTARVIFDV